MTTNLLLFRGDGEMFIMSDIDRIFGKYDNVIKLMKNQTFRFFDQTNEKTFENMPLTAMSSFALDDALATSVSNLFSPRVVRLWSHSDTVVLGIPDSRLPYFHEAANFIKDAGYELLIRNSGGLGVVLDEGIINMSFIVPEATKLSIHECYDTLFRFIQYALSDLTNKIRAYEIVGSYCPGDYDLSIDGIKFAGLSQRRILDGVAVQIYIDVNGDSKKRAKLMRKFYDLGIKNKQTKFTYPVVEHEKMGSLSTLLNKPLTIEDIKERIVQALNDLTSDIITKDLTKYERGHFITRYEQMAKRNEKLNLIIK